MTTGGNDKAGGGKEGKGEGKGKKGEEAGLKCYRYKGKSGGEVRCWFCGECGSHVYRELELSVSYSNSCCLPSCSLLFTLCSLLFTLRSLRTIQQNQPQANLPRVSSNRRTRCPPQQTHRAHPPPRRRSRFPCLRRDLSGGEAGVCCEIVRESRENCERSGLGFCCGRVVRRN